jgi:hypothetical protein
VAEEKTETYSIEIAGLPDWIDRMRKAAWGLSGVATEPAGG